MAICPYYPHMTIGWIYRLLFVILFVCTVTDLSAEDKPSGIKFCTVVHRRPGQGISHYGELCSQKPKMGYMRMCNSHRGSNTQARVLDDSSSALATRRIGMCGYRPSPKTDVLVLYFPKYGFYKAFKPRSDFEAINIVLVSLSLSFDGLPIIFLVFHCNFDDVLYLFNILLLIYENLIKYHVTRTRPFWHCRFSRPRLKIGLLLSAAEFKIPLQLAVPL